MFATKEKTVVTCFFAGVFFALFACESARSPVSATIDGTEWNADESVVASKLSSSVLINAISMQNPPITLQIYSIDATGSFALDGNTNYLLYGEEEFSGYKAIPANPGTLTITQHDKDENHIIGTFSCYAYNSTGDSVNISNGQFDVFYLE